MAFLKYLSPLLLAGALALGADPTPDAGTAWSALKDAKAVPDLPKEWEKTPPTDQALVRQTMRAETERLLAVAGQARQFYTAYPADEHVPFAKRIAYLALTSAQKLGSTTARKQLLEIDLERLANPKLAPDQRLDIRMRQVQAEAEALTETSAAEARDKFEAGARQLLKEFPGEPAPWAMLLECVNQGNDAASRLKLKEIAGGEAPKPIRDRALGILHRYDTLGKTLDLKFTALDGREVDLADLRGKAVIIQFWATWCITCVDGIEVLAKSYENLHQLGVEVIGISLDTDQTKVEKLIHEKGIKWPQFYEKEGQANRLVREWGVTRLPTVWLVDRQGILRDLEAQRDLSKKIESMLGEAKRKTP